MSIDTSKPKGSDNTADLQETIRAIDAAILISRAHNHRFLTDLLEMARLESVIIAGNQRDQGHS